MEKLTAKLSESILDKFSMDSSAIRVLKNAYGNDDTVIAALDPVGPAGLVPVFRPGSPGLSATFPSCWGVSCW